MEAILVNSSQKLAAKQLLDYDLDTARNLVETRIKEAAYNFALGINIDWKEDDILREAKRLAIEIAALKRFDETFEELVKEIEGARI